MRVREPQHIIDQRAARAFRKMIRNVEIEQAVCEMWKCKAYAFADSMDEEILSLAKDRKRMAASLRKIEGRLFADKWKLNNPLSAEIEIRVPRKRKERTTKKARAA